MKGMESQNLQAKIMVIGQSNATRSVILEAILEDRLDRYGVVSTGIDPQEEVDPRTLVLLDQAGHDVDEAIPKSPGEVIDEQLRLVIFMDEEVRQKAPVISVQCPQETIPEEHQVDLPDEWDIKDLNEVYLNYYDHAVPWIVEQIPEEIST